ncbi:MAG: polysaccharide biosynthesis/export family protein [Candidatus Eisenbacteria bacterium]|nr:polysaccharide biosynthesis/export family protein [Candidatus Eisenbacteria bacterium]
MTKRLGVLWMLAVGVGMGVTLTPAAARAEEYVLGADDVIAVSVWLHPELERVLSVDANGNIVFPPVGEMSVLGLTPRQLSDKLSDRLSAYLRQTATVTVTVREFLSHSIYVSGAVARPGRYGFEHIPSLVEVISAAGGALPGAELSRVQVVRQEGDQRHTLIADVASVLRDGSITSLPAMKAGDTVILQAAGGLAGAPMGDGAAVLGEVVRPGVYPASGGLDLWTLLAGAGGLTPRGDLKDIRVITRAGSSQAVIQVNLENALDHGPRAPFVVQAGDVVYVSSNVSNSFSQASAAFTSTLQVALQILNVAVLVDVLKHGTHP